ncbi:NAD(P)-dependent oxidoreductase [Sulfurovum sp. XGS-02]|uniref:NAD-dependent epimerase/dehydratase family protein n=1 Tax=Sulfurovum sp. XGS-02 TaxID=2925411 RepID=UPI002067A804|nr:NAD(P)-dependent oxidoreductase [Sulfurovum sp. XGS-02]UPT76848.1 NAD(P)-dependent oxidoreductase [Sulfurovum sp. XGS-02]
MGTYRIMVTGATGYIGINMISKILQEYDNVNVIAAVRSQEQVNKLQKLFNDDARLSFELGELPNHVWKISNIDILIHTAGILNRKDPIKLFQINVDGTRQLLEKAKEAKVKRFIYMSSQSVYGTKGTSLWHEEMPAHPEVLYAESKYAGELLCMKEAFSTLQTVILRVARVYGDGLFTYQGILPHYYAGCVAKKEPIPIFTYNKNSVNYIHISDLTEAISKVISTLKLPNKLLLNIGGDRAYTNLELGHICQNVAEFCQCEKPSLLFIKKHIQASQALSMDITKAKKYLDWSPTTTMEEGMIQLIKARIDVID